MGRSKFPGRPSKHCHRKRVNVLPSTGESNQEGDTTTVTVIGACKENKQDEDLCENEGESTSQTQSTEPLRRRLSRKLSTTIRKNGRQRNFITKIRSKTTLKNSRVSRNSLGKRHVRKDTANYAGKFVLPTRSVHSSRVIKPNKRFIDLNETLNVKKRSLVKRPMKQLEDKSNSSDSDFKDKLAFSNGHKVILRQARLKLPNQVSTQGPFSSNLHNGPGTIVCGVCGAVRYYRFMKQARKFNIYSCESCRKFITKQIKRQNVGSGNSNVLICLAGQGTCYIPPVERSQHWKMSKCAYRARCPACWLKMCLKAYHLPLSLKENLTQLLPKSMRGIDFSCSNLPPILWQRNTESVSNITTPMDKVEVTTTKQRPVRFKSSQKSQPSVPPVICDVKRQKIDLKGPRVKHVCRSASIVLGQPLAMFGDNSVDKKSNTVSDSIDSSSELSKVDSPSVTDEEVVSSGNSCKGLMEKVVVLPKKERTRSLPIPSIPETIPPPTPPPKGILLDQSQELNFENRYKVGFSLMISKEISTSAMCFLCGSMGYENIVVCCMCCEPYHTFCIEEYGVPVRPDNDWICMRCAPCQGCKGYDRSKISCPKCLRIYHNECFSNREDISSPKLICKECTKCQDCHTATAYNLSSFPGNLPLCLNCLDKRKVGKHCPICRHSFEDSSSNSKMLECLKCKKWVHADCEKLTSEQYDVLKLLPTSSNFTCSQCLVDSNTSWRAAVQREMYRNFNRVLRLLIKNKSARMILKKVGVKGSLFRKYMLTKNLDIDNNNYNKDIDKIYSFEESERLQKEPGGSSVVNTLQEIKYRLCDYNSVKRFNNDMLEALKLYDSEQLMVIYKNIFQSVFSWFGGVHESDSSSGNFCFSQAKTCNFSVNCPLSFNRCDDNRQCELCQQTGDGLDNQESRLLYCGNNTWVHANCAFWSMNVYEQVDNHLQNVILAIETSRTIQCGVCDKFGASIQCHLCRTTSYHFMCARKAEFYFVLPKKATFCSKHSPESHEGVLKADSDFEVNRSLFIEQATQKDILRSKPEKITCIIGSLCVRKLGRIDPVVSDTVDAIIPSGFLCSKVFWSTKNPWKLVTYIISTSIQNPNCTTLTVDKNFTVDHSLGPERLEKALKEVKDWCHIYEKRSEDIDSEDEEEKNGTELLSPELTDTILEDLPHDLLDGISVQDIFPNFNYEDMLCLDNSNSGSITDSKKVSEEDDLSKSDNLHRASSKVPPLSLTVSCKVDPPVTKKRKLSKEPSQHNLLLLQLDGTFDDSASECGSPTGDAQVWGIISEEPVSCEKCQCTYRTQASYKRHLDSCEVLCTSESDSENIQEQEILDETAVIASTEVATTVHVSETSQPVLIQAFESYQSQVHTSVVNVVPESAPQPQPPQQQVSVQPTLTIQEPAPISISVPLCMGTSLMQPSIEFQQPQTQQMTLQTVPQVLVQRPPPPLPRRDPVVIQQIQPAPTPGFVPFVDAFGQTQQYVQLAPQVQPQLLQIRPDGNVIGILPSIQPTTVIVQQPQQLVLDSSGTFGWAQQPQPQIYYGFETIVQNTVMQSQQFLPTPVPGVLTANSSYSTTTQVFQTSKLEPVLDVSSNSFVLVNSSGQLEMSQPFSQASPTVVSSQTPTLIYSSQSGAPKSLPPPTQNCISLPANTTIVSEQSVPMNVVPPRPKTSHSRPMNRVLPMLTNSVKNAKKPPPDTPKMFSEVEKPSQIKLDEKLIFSKDLLKVIDNPKARNRKFEVLDYKLIHPQPKMFDKPFKEFEPVEKLPKLSSTYEPLKEIEKVEREMFEKPTLKEDKFIKNLPIMETFHMHTPAPPPPRIKPEINIKISPKGNEQKYHFINTENALQKLQNSIHKMPSPKPKPDVNNGNLVPKYENKLTFPSIKEITNTNVTLSSLTVEIPPKPPVVLNSSIQDKALDMPQLDDLIKPNEPKPPQFSLQPPEKTCKLESFTKNTNTLAVAPLLSVKPQQIHRPAPEPILPKPITIEKPKIIEQLERRPPIKKEPEPSAAPAIMYTVENKEEGFKCSSTSITECWAKVLEAVQRARAAHNMPLLPTDGKQIKSVQITGLKSSHVKYLVEQLPGASKCVKYKPLFKFTPHSQDSDVCSHGFGAVRCQPHKDRNSEPYDIFSWLSSKHREPFESLDSQTVQSRRVNNFPMAMKFKNLKLTSKYSVGVYRSKIHGKGLFCLRDIEPGEMVIEYAGEVIRSILTDKREKYYNSKGIGCYMFRVDDNCVVDATMKGNAARFINHSCDPNCYSKVVEIMGHKHIIIFALRRILSGEELTYDYKFPFEEDKIPCTCGARRCRKFLN